MCLLAVMFRCRGDWPLVVAANRDELLARPAAPFGVLRAEGPRILGGRDLTAGGTWLAVNEHGVVAGLTNRSVPGGPDPERASRGYLPWRAAEAPSARAAVEALVRETGRTRFNPCWMLVGDRRELFHLELDGDGPARVEELAPGCHVLENRPLAPVSGKAARVRAALEAAVALPAAEGLARLQAVLADHQVPAGVPPEGLAGAAGAPRPRETEAACVHLAAYGTRASTLVAVPAAEGRPRVWHLDDAPCHGELREASPAWDAALPAGEPERAELEAVLRRPGAASDPGLPDSWAAVALVLHRSPGEREPRLLWIQRARNPRDPWSGQMAFPGGRGEVEDGNSRTTATRETREELGLDLSGAAYLGPLAEVRARNREGVAGFKVAPHAFWLPALPELRLDAQEVAATHSIPLAYLADPARRESFEYAQGALTLKLPAIAYRGERIWGLSLRVLDDLLGRVRGTPLGLRISTRA